MKNKKDYYEKFITVVRRAVSSDSEPIMVALEDIKCGDSVVMDTRKIKVPKK